MGIGAHRAVGGKRLQLDERLALIFVGQIVNCSGHDLYNFLAG